MRLTPTLIWQDQESLESKQVAIGEHEIYLANPVPAFILPFLIVVFLVLIIVYMAKRGRKSAIQYICNKEGYLSLSRAQVATWTIVIGGMITAYGLMRLEVPQIPASLVALMGLSLATGGISYAQSGANKESSAILLKSETSVSSAGSHKTSIADLVMDHAINDKNSLSIARAQMVFWTALTLILFVVKSILDGDLWAVPWELVALMGLSQAGYLAPKINLKVDNS